MGLKFTSSKMHSPHKKTFFKKGVKLDRSAGDRGPGEAPAGAWGCRGPLGSRGVSAGSFGWAAKKEGLN